MRPQHNAVGSVVYHATPADVDTVLIAGRPVKRHGRLLDVDLGLLLDRADASAQEVLTRARRRSPTLRPEVDLPPQALNEIALKNLAPAWS
jgi:hypothetical protein